MHSSQHRGTPPAEAAIDVPLIRRLLHQQHPDLAALAIEEIDSGWDNAMFRLGDELAVRVPRRALGADLLLKERTWLPQLRERLPIPIPAPVRHGAPGAGYRWHWSIVAWIDGAPADIDAPEGGQTVPFARFMRALHVEAPADAPVNPVRGVPLERRAGKDEQRMARLAERTELVTGRIRSMWLDALSAPIDTAPRWLHGDLHPRNIIVRNGAIAGIIDWGDLTQGDHATDLAAIWMLFDRAEQWQNALEEYGGVSDATLRRALGWAISFGLVLLDTGLVDHPRHAAMGERILQRLDRFDASAVA